ncbi:hypothetical protein [Helicobacter macacae]|uniref:hypothetical protein n=1 Tax=Helicobacter macacae TaxID=398626 RepID=UPI000414A750|nr:hypothetical protein [Helicobacter macacae]
MGFLASLVLVFRFSADSLGIGLKASFFIAQIRHDFKNLKTQNPTLKYSYKNSSPKTSHKNPHTKKPRKKYTNKLLAKLSQTYSKIYYNCAISLLP